MGAARRRPLPRSGRGSLRATQFCNVRGPPTDPFGRHFAVRVGCTSWRAAQPPLTIRNISELRCLSLALLRVRVGVYHCGVCLRHFRVSPPFLRPGASYTYRVVATSVHAVFTNGMAMCSVPERLARDLRVRPSASSIRAWCRAYAAARTPGDDYRA